MEDLIITTKTAESKTDNDLILTDDIEMIKKSLIRTNIADLQEALTENKTPNSAAELRDNNNCQKCNHEKQPAIARPLDLEKINLDLEEQSAPDVIRWAHNTFGDDIILSTSFGIQSAVMLHMVTQVMPNIPVVWIDTGYLPKETYIFAEQLIKRLQLNIKVYQSGVSPARMEAIHGKLYEERNLSAITEYNNMRKVEPMKRAVQDLGAKAMFSGLRKQQTKHRQGLNKLSVHWNDHYKILPILTWHNREVHRYLKKHDLPYHPFFELGYTSVGDWHTSRPVTGDDQNDRDTRFHGLKQECGLHV